MRRWALRISQDCPRSVASRNHIRTVTKQRVQSRSQRSASVRLLPGIFLPVLLLAAIAGQAQNAAQDGATHGKKTVRALRTELPVTLDGNLDEQAWQEAPISLGFVQRDPQEGAESQPEAGS